MATNWVVPDSDDVNDVMSLIANTAANTVDGNGSQRIANLLLKVVAEFRGCVIRGLRIALSLTPNSVPPEALRWVAVMTADQLVSTQPGLSSYAESPEWQKLKAKAQEFFDAVARGARLTNPSDPDPANTPSTLEWADLYGDSEDYANGFTIDQFGNQTPIPNTDMTIN